MKPRRWLQFSLRTLLVVMTAFTIPLGIIVNRAYEQREAVAAIEALGGAVIYDWQPSLRAQSRGTWSIHYEATHWTNFFTPKKGQPGGPAWLRRLIGDDFFQDVATVNLSIPSSVSEDEVLQLIPRLQRLRNLKFVAIAPFRSERLQNELKAALPACEVLPAPIR